MRHRRMLAPINSIKHYVQTPNSAVATGTALSVKLVNAVVAPATSNAFDVTQGAVIKAIYIEYWLIGDGSSGIESQFVFMIEKKRDSEPDATQTNMLNLGSYPNKKNILYTTQGIIPPQLDGGMSIPVFKGWVLIPKGKQRFGLEDELNINISSVGALRFCGFSTYKEYR